MLTEVESGALPASIDDLKAYLRIATADEDGVLERLLRSAGALCEAFIGQWLIVREVRETVAAGAAWHRLSARPVVSIEAVEAVATGLPLTVGDYAIDIDAAGDGWVRVTRTGVAGMVRVTYRAGLAEAAAQVPEALRQGMVRLAAEHFIARGTESAAPPAVVSALWRPFRRMRLK